jgi:ribosomal protein S18 acetylase RimI-like enzyme
MGKKLISTAIYYASAAKAKRLLLGVYADNQRALGFYNHTGFKQLGTRKFYVGGIGYDDNILGIRLNT